MIVELTVSGVTYLGCASEVEDQLTARITDLEEKLRLARRRELFHSRVAALPVIMSDQERHDNG